MEKLPTDSPSAVNKDSVATRRSPSRTIRENVHTNVLGRDAGDSASREVGFGTDIYENKTNERKSGLLGFWGGNNSETNEASNINNVNRKRRNNNARYDGLQQSLEDGAYDPPPLTTATVGSASSVATDATPTVATAATREDRVRQECSAFYRGVEEGPTTPFHRTRGRRKGRSSADSNSLLRRMSIRARLSGEVDGALFMSRYEKLNATIDSQRRRRPKARHLRGQQYTGNDNSNANQDNDNHDLFLDENDDGQQPSSYREHIPSPTNNVVMGAANLSNPHGVRSRMFFEQDGKVLMRLPRDQVRLVMDYNLEPGILSVEQWRSQEDATAASEKLAAQNARSRMSSTRERENRRRRRERRRRRRRRRRKRKQQQQQEEEKQQDDEEKKQSALETVVLEEGKPKDVEDLSDSNNNGEEEDDDDDSYSSYSDDYDSDLDDDEDDYFDEDLMPELKYVITIPDDLYRRMVADMSSKLIPPYWGFFKCCNQESERADIRLALVILAVVMSLLFIGSLEWRTT